MTLRTEIALHWTNYPAVDLHLRMEAVATSEQLQALVSVVDEIEEMREIVRGVELGEVSP